MGTDNPTLQCTDCCAGNVSRLGMTGISSCDLPHAQFPVPRCLRYCLTGSLFFWLQGVVQRKLTGFANPRVLRWKTMRGGLLCEWLRRPGIWRVGEESRCGACSLPRLSASSSLGAREFGFFRRQVSRWACQSAAAFLHAEACT